MADARTLLRQQRAARQQAQKPQKQSPAPAAPAAPTSRKRKAADEDVEERKRTRTEEDAGVPAGFFDAGVSNTEEATTESPTAQEDATSKQNPQPDVLPPQPPQPPQLDAAAEAELDAFMNEIEKERPPPMATYASGAVIEAKPMTAAEIAAQAREEQSAQRAKRDEEMEGEKEDAARALEDEFEEMDGLEERVRKLREQREALRAKRSLAPKTDTIVQSTPLVEDDGSESEDEDWDDWRFHPA